METKETNNRGEIRYKITIDGTSNLKELRTEIEELGKTARQTAQDLEYLGSALEKAIPRCKDID
jgi:hypothetical protein